MNPEEQTTDFSTFWAKCKADTKALDYDANGKLAIRGETDADFLAQNTKRKAR